MADAGFGVEAAARQFNLDFVPIAGERYFLMLRAADAGVSLGAGVAAAAARAGVRRS